jgi:FKBP-type peptidyl-prolyl cis-trans isomerase FkpA
MKVHFLVGVFALFFVCCAVAYVALAPGKESAPTYPGEAVSGEPAKAENGVMYHDIKVGTGPTIPNASTTFRAKYAGYLLNGTKFDSNDNASFTLGRLIKGWSDGMKDMKVGGKRKLIIPAARAYGNDPQPNIPAGSTLVFDIELLGIQ